MKALSSYTLSFRDSLVYSLSHGQGRYMPRGITVLLLDLISSLSDIVFYNNMKHLQICQKVLYEDEIAYKL